MELEGKSEQDGVLKSHRSSVLAGGISAGTNGYNSM